MVNWMSPEVIGRTAVVFNNFVHALFGLYMWEWFISLPFDWSFLTGKRRFRWPLIFYTIGRYGMIFVLGGVVVSLNVTSEINCQALYTFNAFWGNVTIGMASINLSLRTIAVWSQALYITIPLVICILGHWTLLLHGVLLKAVFVPGTGCVITETSTTILRGTFIYAMCLDFIVLCLTGYKLVSGSGIGMNGRSRLVKLIFKDGLIYFIITFLANMVAVIFLTLNLNPIMSIIFDVPAAIISTIMASRAVRRLSDFTHRGPEMFSGNQAGNSTIAFRGATAVGRSKPSKQDAVHVQMDTFTLAETTAQASYIEYSASGKIKNDSDLDPESQEIHDEFKRPPY